MRFLADAGISPRTITFLRRRGEDAVHVRELAMQRASDRQVVEKAQVDERILLTFDLGFGAILALGVLNRPTTVIFRLTDERADAVNQRLDAVISESKVRRFSRARSSSSKTRVPHAVVAHSLTIRLHREATRSNTFPTRGSRAAARQV